jgi:hypothetical protein
MIPFLLVLFLFLPPLPSGEGGKDRMMGGQNDEDARINL